MARPSRVPTENRRDRGDGELLNDGLQRQPTLAAHEKDECREERGLWCVCGARVWRNRDVTACRSR